MVNLDILHINLAIISLDGCSGWEASTTFTRKNVLKIVNNNFLLIVSKVLKGGNLIISFWNELIDLLTIFLGLFKTNIDVASEMPRFGNENLLVLPHAIIFLQGFARLESEAADDSAVDEEASGNFDHFQHAVGKLTSDVDYEEASRVLGFTDTVHGKMKIFNCLNIVLDAMGVVHAWHVDQLDHSFSSEHLTAVEINLLGTTPG